MAEANAPFFGTWDCGFLTYTFDADTFSNGFDTYRVSAIMEETPSSFIITSLDDVVVILDDIAADAMTLTSNLDYERRTCRRIEPAKARAGGRG